MGKEERETGTCTGKRQRQSLCGGWVRSQRVPRTFLIAPHLCAGYTLFLPPHPPTFSHFPYTGVQLVPEGQGRRLSGLGLPLKLFPVPQTHRLARQEVPAPTLSCERRAGAWG